MKRYRTLSLSLLVSLGLTFPGLLHAQTPPASTFHPGPWQPVTRVDTSRPVKIKIVNNTDIPLNYDLSANLNSSPQQISPGQSTTLTEFTIPAFILINRSDSAPISGVVSLLFTVNVNKDNLATINVTRTPGVTPGYTTFNLNKQGAIYIY